MKKLLLLSSLFLSLNVFASELVYKPSPTISLTLRPDIPCTLEADPRPEIHLIDAEIVDLKKLVDGKPFSVIGCASIFQEAQQVQIHFLWTEVNEEGKKESRMIDTYVPLNAFKPKETF